MSEVVSRFFNCEWEAWDIAKWMLTSQFSKEGGDSDRIAVRRHWLGELLLVNKLSVRKRGGRVSISTINNHGRL